MIMITLNFVIYILGHIWDQLVNLDFNKNPMERSFLNEFIEMINDPSF